MYVESACSDIIAKKRYLCCSIPVFCIILLVLDRQSTTTLIFRRLEMLRPRHIQQHLEYLVILGHPGQANSIVVIPAVLDARVGPPLQQVTSDCRAS